MTLDVRTVVVMLVLNSVLMTLTLAVGIRSGRSHGFAKWNLGLGLYALGWLLIAARGTLPQLLTMAGADALLLAGLCLQLAAVLEIGDASAPRWLLYAPGPLLFAIITPLMDHYAIFTFVASLSYTTAMLAIAGATIRAGATAGPARWMLAAAYAAGGVILAVRAVLTLLDPAAQAGLFAPGLLHAVTFIAMFAVIATGSIAFLLMLRERAEAALRHLAMFDPLTGLLNRRAFIELAERELARARRTAASCAVLMMDLDWFKRVNDEFGHQAGDRVLADFAAAARRSFRTEDFVGRYGGEEFCAILPGVGREWAIEIAERVRQAVSRQPLGGLPRPTTVSIGVSIARGGTLDEAIARADLALYRAKEEGRNRVIDLDPGASEDSYPRIGALPAGEPAAADRTAPATAAH